MASGLVLRDVRWDWEHGYGAKTSTVDNPGWRLRVRLLGTGLEDKPFEKIQVERHEHGWVMWSVLNGCFEGAGGPMNLGEPISVFRAWAAPVLKIKSFPWADAVEGEE
ncbi:Imm53 family immunity protein [Deinococcus apachensis]|uniref:Imm53 family immunity protein n=1 Tax=Deinococcus apachensis TaxID=309886 RepID=UPI001B7F7FD9